MRLIDADALMEKYGEWYIGTVKGIVDDAPTIDAVIVVHGEWIPCEKQLPRVGTRVLLCLTNGQVLIGHRDRPDLVWQVTEKGGRKHWVYDPEAYTDDIDSLPKAEDCGFSQDSDYADGFLSVTSVNYDKRFGGVVAWMPLPQPYGERKESE